MLICKHTIKPSITCLDLKQNHSILDFHAINLQSIQTISHIQVLTNLSIKSSMTWKNFLPNKVSNPITSRLTFKQTFARITHPSNKDINHNSSKIKS